MNILILILFIVYCIIGAIVSSIGIKKFLSKEVTEKAKLDNYKKIIIAGWIPVIIIITLLLFNNIPLSEIGFSLFSFQSNTVLTIISLIIFSLMLLLSLYKILAFLFSEKYRVELKKEVDKLFSSDEYKSKISKAIIPKTKKEKRMFLGVCLTAGIAEEIVYRGFSIFILASVFPNLSIYIIVFLSAILFGFIHFYQGVKGLIATTIIGLIWGLLYITTGSLILPIIAHFANNYSSAFLFETQE